MRQPTIGNFKVGEIGLGCMGMTHGYGPSNEKENLTVLEKAVEIGCNFWDTADFYSAGRNEELLGKILKKKKEKVFIATKVGIAFNLNEEINQDTQNKVNGEAKYIKKAIERSLNRLNVDYIDLCYLHRVDPNTPIEETIDAMKDLVNEGKIRYLGLSEASVDTIIRASKIHQISALQSEYSIWYRDIENEILPLCEKMNISVVPFAPLGRGFLTGNLKHFSDLSLNDWRRKFPRFKEEVIQQNMHIVSKIQEIAQNYDCAPATIALSWILSKSPNLIPIPGTRHLKYLLENARASEIRLKKEEMDYLQDIKVVGERFPSYMEKAIDKNNH